MSDNIISQKEYDDLVKEKSPSSKLFINCLKAFLIGGIICVIGQCFLSFYKSLNLSEELAGGATSVSMVFIGVLLTGLDIYPKIAKHGGAGTLVPITGFSNAVAAPAIEAKTEGYILGVGAKIFTIAGPVILYGTVASFVAGIIFLFMK
ncbi:MAG: stage V sporulation protein AC [Clostridia bacterium]|nr:stage V sporulation protein AC [Clostridia bacterium]